MTDRPDKLPRWSPPDEVGGQVHTTFPDTAKQDSGFELERLPYQWVNGKWKLDYQWLKHLSNSGGSFTGTTEAVNSIDVGGTADVVSPGGSADVFTEIAQYELPADPGYDFQVFGRYSATDGRRFFVVENFVEQSTETVDSYLSAYELIDGNIERVARSPADSPIDDEVRGHLLSTDGTVLAEVLDDRKTLNVWDASGDLSAPIYSVNPISDAEIHAVSCVGSGVLVLRKVEVSTGVYDFDLSSHDPVNGNIDWNLTINSAGVTADDSFRCQGIASNGSVVAVFLSNAGSTEDHVFILDALGQKPAPGDQSSEWPDIVGHWEVSPNSLGGGTTGFRDALTFCDDRLYAGAFFGGNSPGTIESTPLRIDAEPVFREYKTENSWLSEHYDGPGIVSALTTDGEYIYGVIFDDTYSAIARCVIRPETLQTVTTRTPPEDIDDRPDMPACCDGVVIWTLGNYSDPADEFSHPIKIRVLASSVRARRMIRVSGNDPRRVPNYNLMLPVS